MSDPIHHLNVLHNNPFILAKPMQAFFKELGYKEQSILLAYLVLPLTLHMPSRTFLKRARSNSSIRSMVKERKRIYALDLRMHRHREMTNLTLQYLLSHKALLLMDKMVIQNSDNQELDCPSPDGVLKAAISLARIFSPYDVPTIYRKLGLHAL